MHLFTTHISPCGLKPLLLKRMTRIEIDWPECDLDVGHLCGAESSKCCVFVGLHPPKAIWVACRFFDWMPHPGPLQPRPSQPRLMGFGFSEMPHKPLAAFIGFNHLGPRTSGEPEGHRSTRPCCLWPKSSPADASCRLLAALALAGQARTHTRTHTHTDVTG